MENSSLRFAEAARLLAEAARVRSLRSPAYRSPPRVEGDRSIRRRPDGGATVAVRYRGRPWPAVLADMIEGVVATNVLGGAAADATRTALWSVLEAAGHLGPAPALAPPDPRLDVLDGEAPPTTPRSPASSVRRLARVA